MGGEYHLRQKIVQALRALDAISVENKVRAGTPDINYIYGWIECKILPRWPVRSDTPVRVPHFTPQQRVWIQRRAASGGIVFVMLQVGTCWLLLDGAWAAQNLGEKSAAMLLLASRLTFHRKFDGEQLCRYLSNQRP